MSSFNRIPKGFIKVSDKKISFNDKLSVTEDEFKASSVDYYLKKSKERIEEEERKMLQEIENKKQALIEKGYEEGKKIAIQEAENILRNEMKEMIDNANLIYNNANEFYQSLLAQSEQIKDNFLLEKKEEIIDTILIAAKKVINQSIDKEQIMVEDLYHEAINKIKYDTKKVFVRVHPKTQELLLSKKVANGSNQVVFLCDLNLEQSDFVIETEREFIDLSVHAQLEEMKEYLRGVLGA